jgi:DNA-binding CsgD family transcriptional regulator
VPLTWPLVGRIEEIQTIHAAIVADADTPGIVVCGAAGIGKSRVVREALSSASAKGCEVRWTAGASSARSIPLGAFAAWTGPAPNDTVQLVRTVIDSLTAAAQGTRVVVGVDDAHLLDDLSTFVLHQIVQRRAAKVILTIRDGEPIPAGTREILTIENFDRLDLQPLSRDETETLLSAVLDGPVEPYAVQRLWKLTRGNVLYLRNIVEQEVGDGRFARHGGHWRWTGDPVVPPGLAELIETRIGALPPSVADVIDVLAVGEPIDLLSLSTITDPAAVEDADTRGLITLDDVDGRVEVRVAHPLYGEVRRLRAPSTRLRRLRGLVADELAVAADSDDIRTLVRRATLSLESDRSPDPDLLVRAAQGAMCLADLHLADRLADAAIRAGAGAEANFVRAHTLVWLTRGKAADTVLTGTPNSEFTAADHARLAFMRASNTLWSLANPPGAKALIDDDSAKTQPSARSCIDAFLAVYWAAMGKPKEVANVTKDVAIDQLPPVAGTEAYWALTTAGGEAGRTEDALAAAEAGYAFVIRTLDAPQLRFVIGDAHVAALIYAGRIGEAIDVGERLRQEAEDLPGGAQLLGAAVAGLAALGAGRLDTACSWLGTAVELLSASGESIGIAYRYSLPNTIALAMRGSSAEAAAALVALEGLWHPTWQHLDYERELARAWVSACQGAISEAIAILSSAAQTACDNGQFAAEVLCLQTATQFGDSSTAVRLQQLSTTVEGPRAAVAARFASALNSGDSAELAAVSGDFERIGDVVASIDAAGHAAMAYRRQELRGSALGCSARAEALATQCGASTPILRRAVEPIPLTDRELEVVALLGEELAPREIAERLVLSVRTVEGHIYRAMARTGVTKREDLIALVCRHLVR